MSMKHCGFLLWVLSLGGVLGVQAQTERIYVAALDDSSCTLAWGTADGKDRNTIGRDAEGLGKVSIRFGEATVSTTKSWHRFEGLTPDTTFVYDIQSNGRSLGSGKVRTWPTQSKSLRFLVIGDWGNGSSEQLQLAARMEQERQKWETTPSPIRFVLSTGDNIYAGGREDRDWEKKFFAPYAATLRSVPFYAVLGNHDGNESENPGDLPAYLDNFFSPSGPMTRWYRFQYGGFAEFFALDSTTNQNPGPSAPAFLPDGEQSQWLNQQLAAPALPWRIAFFHHPMFTAGPHHPPSLPKLKHWWQQFHDHGVSAVFSGHEHNLQFSERNAATGGMLFALSGAGGELRKGSVKSRMQERNIAAWAAQVHFLLVEIEGDSMSITPISNEPLRLQDAAGKSVAVPLVVPRRQN